MSPQQETTEIEVTTLDREHLSEFLYRILGFVNSQLLTDTLKRNPHLTDLPTRYPENTKIVVPINIEPSPEAQVQTLWS